MGALAQDPGTSAVTWTSSMNQPSAA